MMVCDFCDSPAVKWIYPAKDCFLYTAIVFEPGVEPRGQEAASEGGWAACDHCSRLIEAGDRDGLFRRCVEAYGAETQAAEFFIKRVHGGFWENRTGARQAHQQEGGELK